jgi:hypothetical protein
MGARNSSGYLKTSVARQPNKQQNWGHAMRPTPTTGQRNRTLTSGVKYVKKQLSLTQNVMRCAKPSENILNQSPFTNKKMIR